MVKRNTQSSKKLLEAALQNLPENRHTSNVRTCIYQAINEIERVEKRDFRKAQEAAQLTPAEKWKLDLETGRLVGPTIGPSKFDAIGKIDEMINAEKTKIDQIKEQQVKPTETGQLFD